MNSSVSALTALSPNAQAVALPSATARTALARLPSPLELKARQPLPLELASQVAASRDAIRAILDGDDPRLLVVVGPCSIHDPRSALEYAERLAALSDELDGQLLLVMRAYVEKPRTTVGWKGLAYDPHLDGSDDMAAGLALSRQLMLDMLRLGLPLATELLQPLAAGYFDDLLSWAAIGAHQRIADPPRAGQRPRPAGGLQERHRRRRRHRLRRDPFGGPRPPPFRPRPARSPGADRDPRQSGHPCGAARRPPRFELRSRAGAGRTPGPGKPGHRHADDGRLQSRQQRQEPAEPARRPRQRAGPAPGRRQRPGRGNAGKPPVRRLPGARRRTALRRLDHRRLPRLGRHRADSPRRRPAARRGR